MSIYSPNPIAVQDVDDDSSEGDGDEERKIKRVRR